MSALSPTNYHLRPARGWLNDPNGMVYHQGRWHVFFQHNPDGPKHERIAWGHASSTDLLSWREHPLAFSPTPDGPDQHGCWSGVVVIEDEGPVALYSGIASEDGRSTVCLRRGSADLLTWGPPAVVVAQTPEVDGVAVMRDPFVFRHQGRRFALLGAGLEDGSPAILLFSCDDLTQWDYLGLWLTATDDVVSAALPADVWECPQLAVRGPRASLVLSMHDDGVLGPVVACTGELVDDGGVPRLVPEQVSVLDTGSAFYAPQLAGDGGEGWWLMGWVRDEAPDLGSDHAGCMTLPRRLMMDDAGARLILDPAVQTGLASGADRSAPGLLIGHLRVEVGAEGAGLVHEELEGLALPAGTLVFVDGPVLEAYPPGEAPATFRHPEPWSMNGNVEVRDVLTSARESDPLPPTGRAIC